jgi:hypothetical protein
MVYVKHAKVISGVLHNLIRKKDYPALSKTAQKHPLDNTPFHSFLIW